MSPRKTKVIAARTATTAAAPTVQPISRGVLPRIWAGSGPPRRRRKRMSEYTSTPSTPAKITPPMIIAITNRVWMSSALRLPPLLSGVKKSANADGAAISSRARAPSTATGAALRSRGNRAARKAAGLYLRLEPARETQADPREDVDCRQAAHHPELAPPVGAHVVDPGGDAVERHVAQHDDQRDEGHVPPPVVPVEHARGVEQDLHQHGEAREREHQHEPVGEPQDPRAAIRRQLLDEGHSRKEEQQRDLDRQPDQDQVAGAAADRPQRRLAARVEDRRVGELVEPVHQPEGETREHDVEAAALDLHRVHVDRQPEQCDGRPLERARGAERVLCLTRRVSDRQDRGAHRLRRKVQPSSLIWSSLVVTSRVTSVYRSPPSAVRTNLRPSSFRGTWMSPYCSRGTPSNPAERGCCLRPSTW